MDTVSCGGCELLLVAGGVVGRGRSSDVEETTDEAGQSWVDRLRSCRTSGVDLATELLGLKTDREEGEESDDLSLRTGGRASLIRTVVKESTAIP